MAAVQPRHPTDAATLVSGRAMTAPVCHGHGHHHHHHHHHDHDHDHRRGAGSVCFSHNQTSPLVCPSTRWAGPVGKSWGCRASPRANVIICQRKASPVFRPHGPNGCPVDTGGPRKRGGPQATHHKSPGGQPGGKRIPPGPLEHHAARMGNTRRVPGWAQSRPIALRNSDSDMESIAGPYPAGPPPVWGQRFNRASPSTARITSASLASGSRTIAVNRAHASR